MSNENDTIISTSPPSQARRLWNTVTSKSFWESASSLYFWEQGCLGRSMVTGIIVGSVTGLHRYRNVRSIPRAFDRFGIGFMLGLTFNYLSCRRLFEQINEKQAKLAQQNRG